MAIDARIALLAGTPRQGVGSRILSGLQAGEGILTSRARVTAAREAAKQAQQQTQSNERAAAAEVARISRGAAEAAKQLPIEQREAFINNTLAEAGLPPMQPASAPSPPIIGQGGADLGRMTSDVRDFSDAGLDAAISRADALIAGASGGDLRAISNPVIVDTPQGPAFGQLTQRGGTLSSELVPIGGTLLDRQGLDVAGRVGQAGQIAGAQTQARQDVRGATEPQIAGDVAQAQADVSAATAADIAGETQRGKGIAKRRDDDIAAAQDAARGVPTIKRALTLLNTVETGGLAAAQTAIRQRFGVEGADEGELSANLGRAVLSQLRTTFGSQFTEREGARLEGIEARMGANTRTNKRLLSNALTIMEGAVEKGIRAATEARDFRTAADLQDALTATLDPEPTQEELQAEARRRGLIQ